MSAAPAAFAKLLADADWERRVERERKGDAVLSVPMMPETACETVERVAGDAGVDPDYDAGRVWLRASLKSHVGPSEISPQPARERPKRTVGGRDHRSWAQRLRPAMQTPNEWVEFVSGTPGSAKSAVSALRGGKYGTPGGRWEFAWDVCRVRARYLGPGHA